MIIACGHESDEIKIEAGSSYRKGVCAACWSFINKPEYKNHYLDLATRVAQKQAENKSNAPAKPCCGKSLAKKAVDATKSFAYWSGQFFKKPSQEELSRRESICHSCPKLDGAKDVCNECGCYLKKVLPVVGDVGKRNHAHEACPLKLWDAV